MTSDGDIHVTRWATATQQFSKAVSFCQDLVASLEGTADVGSASRWRNENELCIQMNLSNTIECHVKYDIHTKDKTYFIIYLEK